MARYLPELYESPGGKENYWDNVPLDVYNKDFYIEARECKEGDVMEIDTLSELPSWIRSIGFKKAAPVF